MKIESSDGDIVRQFFKSARAADPRTDILISLGIVLDGNRQASISGDDWDLRVYGEPDPDDDSCTIYSITYKDKGTMYSLVFESRIWRGARHGELRHRVHSPGDWVARLAVWDHITRQRKQRRLSAGQQADGNV